MEKEAQVSLPLIAAHIGKQLFKRREKWEMPQKQLGEYIGVSGQQMQKYETGVNPISAAELYKICFFLECEIGYFFHHIHQENPAIDLDFPEYDAISMSVSPEMQELVEYWKELHPSCRSNMLNIFRSIVGKKRDKPHMSNRKMA